MCLAVFYNAQPRVPIYHDFLYYFGSLRIYIVSRSPIKPVNDYFEYINMKKVGSPPYEKTRSCSYNYMHCRPMSAF